MTRKFFAFTLTSLLLALCFPSAHAQQPGKLARIGYLDASNAAGSAVLVDALRQELNKLGWIEGENIVIEHRFAEQNNERLPEHAVGLVRLRVDLILVVATPAAFEAAQTSQPVAEKVQQEQQPRKPAFPTITYLPG